MHKPLEKMLHRDMTLESIKFTLHMKHYRREEETSIEIIYEFIYPSYNILN
jgi:hypothetical protein